jgi:hypothetical protein
MNFVGFAALSSENTSRIDSLGDGDAAGDIPQPQASHDLRRDRIPIADQPLKPTDVEQDTIVQFFDQIRKLPRDGCQRGLVAVDIGGDDACEQPSHRYNPPRRPQSGPPARPPSDRR